MQLDYLISRYPWYTIGFLDSYLQLVESDPEGAQSYLKKVATRIYSREELYFCREGREGGRGQLEEKIDSGEADSIIEESNQKVVEREREEPLLEFGKSFGHQEEERVVRVVVGSDYFSHNDFDSVELNGDNPVDNYISENPSLLKSTFIASSQEREPIIELDSAQTEGLLDDISCYTETLAAIYSEQGYYKEALEVYSKLILLNPKKKSYFASLIEEVKRKKS